MTRKEVLEKHYDKGDKPKTLRKQGPKGTRQKPIKQLKPYALMTMKEKYAFNDSVTHVYEAAGCLTCHQTGYLGREAVVELLSFEEDVSHRIIKESQSGLLRKTAKERGISTLWDRAIEKVLSGKTTLAEVDRVLGGFS